MITDEIISGMVGSMLKCERNDKWHDEINSEGIVSDLMR